MKTIKTTKICLNCGLETTLNGKKEDFLLFWDKSLTYCEKCSQMSFHRVIEE